MKNKKALIVIALIAVAAVYYFFIRKSAPTTAGEPIANNNPFSPNPTMSEFMDPSINAAARMAAPGYSQPATTATRATATSGLKSQVGNASRTATKGFIAGQTVYSIKQGPKLKNL